MNREINRVSDRGACRKKNGKVISGKINSIVSGNWEQREANSRMCMFAGDMAKGPISKRR